MIIINSGAYVTQELQAEFGEIPPSLLPLANRKLVEHQVKVLQACFPGEPVVVSLPDKYVLTRHEESLFARLNTCIITTPEEFSLAAALLYTLNVSDSDSGVRILHGDTLFSDFPSEMDVVSIATSHDNYRWEKQNIPCGSLNYVWTGFFSFSCVKTLIRSLALCKDSFTDAVRKYGEKHPLTYKTIGKWYDLGHMNTYFRSRSEISTSRVFNSINVEANILTKTGEPQSKIKAEREWYRNLPGVLKRYRPQVLGDGVENGTFFYQLEYLPINPLSELFVHGKNPLFFWEYVFSLIKEFLSETLLFPGNPQDIHATAQKLYADKTWQRLRNFTELEAIDNEQPMHFSGRKLPSLQEICDECITRTQKLPLYTGILHGDLCFSNILIDLRSGMIKVIDPRGIDMENNNTIYGDVKYDLAKLTHSAIGLYDFIISGYYHLTVKNSHHYDLCFDIDTRLEAIQNIFWTSEFLSGVTTEDIMPLTILLFLSMLPLHSDKHVRQQALLANALRLYNNYILG